MLKQEVKCEGDVNMSEEHANFDSSALSGKPPVPHNDLIEDIDINGDPYYLKYYRSFHNHELDPNTILNESQLLDEDMIRTGALTLLP